MILKRFNILINALILYIHRINLPYKIYTYIPPRLQSLHCQVIRGWKHISLAHYNNSLYLFLSFNLLLSFLSLLSLSLTFSFSFSTYIIIYIIFFLYISISLYIFIYIFLFFLCT